MPRTAPQARDKQARILIVDDSTVVRLYYRHLLEQAGYRVEEAINGIEGLEKALGAPYDLCIVDVNMPMMDGHAFLQALRRAAATRNVPALVTTTESGPQDRLAAMAAGASAYLVKPVPCDLFVGHVAALLGQAPP
jgi:two-component system chemotaxis response regulator CheY